MLVRLILATAVALVVGCSSSSNEDTTPAGSGTNTDTGDTGTDTGTVPITGDPSSAPTTGIDAVWLGATAFGESVFVIDVQQNMFGFSADGAGRYESIFGNLQSAQALRRFAHRDSDDASLGSAFTPVGDIVSGSETIAYSFSLGADGQSLVNTGNAGEFSLTRADENDLATITPADVAGDWEGRAAICNADGTNCSVFVLALSIAADGTMTGVQKFDVPAMLDANAGTGITGTVTSAGQYLATSFSWATVTPQLRSGVVYRDRTTSNLVFNTIGEKPDTNGELETFSTLLVQQ